MRWVFGIVGGLGILYFAINFMNAFSGMLGWTSDGYSRAIAMNTAIVGVVVIVGFGVIISELRKLE